MASLSGRLVPASVAAVGIPLPPAEKRPDCAGAVVRDGSGRVLLVLRANDPGAGLWSIPGGRIEPGESSRDAAAREVCEETGLDVEVGHLLLTGPVGDYVVDDYAATVVGGTLRPGDDATEARWFTVEQMLALPLAPTVRASLQELGLA